MYATQLKASFDSSFPKLKIWSNLRHLLNMKKIFFLSWPVDFPVQFIISYHVVFRQAFKNKTTARLKNEFVQKSLIGSLFTQEYIKQEMFQTKTQICCRLFIAEYLKAN